MPDIANIATQVLADVFYGDVIDIQCETGYSLAGDNQITCIKDSSYQFNEQPKCLIGKQYIECILFM